MKIAFATADWVRSSIAEGAPSLGGAGHYRLGLPYRWYAQHRPDVEVHIGALVGNAKTGEIGLKNLATEELLWGFDVVVMQRWMNEGLADNVLAARRLGQVVVNDVDDWFDGLDPSNRAFQATHPKANPEVNRTHYRGALAASSCLTVSTSFLAERLARLAHPVVLPNGIDLARWTSPKTAADHLAAGTTPTVGWVGAQPWRSGDLETMRGTLGPILRDLKLPWHHSGHVEDHPPASEAMKLDAGTPTTTRPMCPIEDYPAMFDPIHVGVVPLADKPFNQAKSWIKGLEYAAAGVPFVASPTEQYRCLAGKASDPFLIWPHDPIGRVARNAKEWRRHITELCDPEVRAAEAERQREAVAAFDFDRVGHYWAEVYESVCR